MVAPLGGSHRTSLIQLPGRCFGRSSCRVSRVALLDSLGARVNISGYGVNQDPSIVSCVGRISTSIHCFGLIDFGARGGGRPHAITTGEQNCAIGEQRARVLMTARDHVSCGVEHAGRRNILLGAGVTPPASWPPAIKTVPSGSRAAAENSWISLVNPMCVNTPEVGS